MMRLGHGTAFMPVTQGEAMGGYADREGGVRGTQDPLEVHAVVVDVTGGGDLHWALVVVDLVCVNRDAVLAVRDALLTQLGISGVWLAATHTHAGPESGCHPGGDVTPPAVMSRLVEASVSAARAATEAQAPGRLDAVRVEVKGLAGDRTMSTTGPQGIPIDIVVASSHAELLGLLVVTPVHPTVLGAENTLASADLSGGIRRALKRRFPDGPTGTPWVVTATGAAGDISTRFSRRDREPREIDRLGDVVADAASGAIKDALLAHTAGSAVASADTPDASVATRTVTLMVKQGDDPDGALLSSAPGPDLAVRDKRLLHVLRQGHEIATHRAARHPATISIEIAVAHVSGVTFAAVPAELFLALGTEIRRRAPVPEQTVVLGYTNGYLGYLPTRDSDVGYEVLVSPVAAGSGEQVVDVAVELAHRTHETNDQEQSLV
ncbi:hypothetical protein ACOCJ7_05375 [Knoellia sp. CPCC 206453]|uniref:hypothetical protein n=1 Tax=Knoellia pratensis TaxID=3404796 RepID=UPI0036208D41